MITRRALPLLFAIATLGSGCIATRPHIGLATRGTTRLDSADLEEAARAFDRGVGAYRAGDIESARRWFEAALRVAPEGAVLFNLARVHEALGHRAVAAHFYLRYARESVSISAEMAAEVELALVRLSPHVAWLTLRGARDPRIDSQAIPPSFGGLPIPVSPGAHRVRTSGRTALEVRLEPEQAAVIDLSDPALLRVSHPSPPALRIATVSAGVHH